jgi:hypothetical protein
VIRYLRCSKDTLAISAYAVIQHLTASRRTAERFVRAAGWLDDKISGDRHARECRLTDDH